MKDKLAIPVAIFIAMYEANYTVAHQGSYWTIGSVVLGIYFFHYAINELEKKYERR